MSAYEGEQYKKSEQEKEVTEIREDINIGTGGYGTRPSGRSMRPSGRNLLEQVVRHNKQRAEHLLKQTQALESFLSGIPESLTVEADEGLYQLGLLALQNSNNRW